MIISHFNIIDEEEVLITEEFIDDSNNVVKIHDYTQKPNYITKFIYNEANLLTSETLFQDGKELNSTVFKYHDGGKKNETQLYIAGELYEQIIIKQKEDNTVKTVIRDNVEVSRIEHQIIGDEATYKYYQDSQLTEIQQIKFDKLNNIQTEYIFDNDGKLHFTTVNKFNEKDILVHSKRYIGDGALNSITDFEIEDNLMISEKYRYFNGLELEYDLFNKYDTNGNIINTEYRTPEGGLIGFCYWNFNEKNQLIEQYGNIINDNVSQIRNYHSKYKYS